MSVIKPFCGEKLILIGWAWLPESAPGSQMGGPAESYKIHRLGPNEFISIG